MMYLDIPDPVNTPSHSLQGKEQLIDVPVNMRHRLQPEMRNKHCGFLITELTSAATVTSKTKLWELARQLGQLARQMMEQEQHLKFCQAKKTFETDPATAELAASTESHQVLDVLVIRNNMMD